MNTFPTESEQPPAAPTVIVASTTLQTRCKNYGSRLNVTLGVIQITCGVLLMGFSIALIAIHSPLGPVSDGLWCGIIIVTSLVFSILAAVFVIPVLAFSALDIDQTRYNERRYKSRLRNWENDQYSDYSYRSYYYPKPDDFDAFYALNGLQIFVAVVQGIVAITASAMACGPLCCDGTQTAAAAPRVQYVAHQSGQQVIMMTPQQMHQPVVDVPATMQQGYTAPVLTPAGAPPMYTTIPTAPVAAQMAPAQAQPMPNSAVQRTEDTKKSTIG